MEGEIQIVIDNIDNAMNIFNAMLAAQKSVIFYGIIIFLIGAVIGLLIHRKNHNEALKNILDIINCFIFIKQLFNKCNYLCLHKISIKIKLKNLYL